MQLVIAEKPSVANSIADVLGANERKDGYREGNGYFVSWCVGHLIELAEPEIYNSDWKKWSYESLPMIPEDFLYEVKEATASQFHVLKDLLEESSVDTVINACDAGREGELIFRLVYEMANCSKNMERLWLSSLEENSIRKAFENLKRGSDFNSLYESAKCRQEADWLVGMNATRFFTVLYEGKVLKVGRVMTPTLAMLVDREEKIRSFKKEPYYLTNIISGDIKAVSQKEKDKEIAEKIAKDCEKQNAIVVSVTKEEKKQGAPKLFDLTSLQREANRMYGFTAKQTLEYAQSLYEKKLITYPRTDSQFLSEDMEEVANKVISIINEKLLAIEKTEFISCKKIMDDDKVSDHHALIPTAQLSFQDLEGIPLAEKKILYMIAFRLLSAVSENYQYLASKIILECNEHEFQVEGKVELNKGWKIYDEKLKEIFNSDVEKSSTEENDKIPELVEGQELLVESTDVVEKFTQPPKHFTEDLLLAAMEKAGVEDIEQEVERKGLGTPATRADIIEKLVLSNYVKRDKKNLLPTEDGINLIHILPEMIKTPKLTAEWENHLSLIAEGEYNANDFMQGIKDMIKEMVENHENVSEEEKQLFAKKSEKQELGECPKCGKKIIVGKYGPYCEGKCGLYLKKVRGKELTESQLRELLSKKKVLIKNLENKEGKKYDAYFNLEGYEEHTYNDKTNYFLKINLEFPKKK